MGVAAALRGTTVFVGCGFAAKYRLGGANFSVPLQWSYTPLTPCGAAPT